MDWLIKYLEFVDEWLAFIVYTSKWVELQTFHLRAAAETASWGIEGFVAIVGNHLISPVAALVKSEVARPSPIPIAIAKDVFNGEKPKGAIDVENGF